MLDIFSSKTEHLPALRNFPLWLDLGIFLCDDFLAVPTKSRVFLRNPQLRTSARKLPRSREIRNSTWEAKVKKRRRTKRLLLISGRISEDKKRTLATVSGGRSQWAVTTDRLLSVEPIVPGSCLDQGHRRGQETGPGASHARQLSHRTIGEVLSRLRLSKTTIY